MTIIRIKDLLFMFIGIRIAINISMGKHLILILLTFTIALHSAGLNANTCKFLFANDRNISIVPIMNSTEWNHWISEKPGHTPNPIYSVNMHLAVTQVFEPWFLQKDIQPFHNILANMHKLAGLGDTNNGLGGSYKTQTYETQNLFPGLMRHEVAKLPSPESAELKRFWKMARNDDNFEIPMTAQENSRFQYKPLKEAIERSLSLIRETYKAGKTDVNLVLSEGSRLYNINIKLSGNNQKLTSLYWSNQIPGTISTAKNDFSSAENKTFFNSGVYEEWNGPFSIQNYRSSSAENIPIYLAHAEELMIYLKAHFNKPMPKVNINKTLNSNQVLLLQYQGSYFQT